MRSNINGKVTEQHLCQECAEKLGYTHSLRSHFRPMSLFSNDSFFSDPFSMLDPFFDSFGTRMLSEFPEPEEKEQAVNNTKVTAPDKSPSLIDETEQKALVLQRKKNALRHQLQNAIEHEEFEQAAKLRDELRSLDV